MGDWAFADSALQLREQFAWGAPLLASPQASTEITHICQKKALFVPAAMINDILRCLKFDY